DIPFPETNCAMKAAFVKRKNNIRIMEIPTPAPQRAEVLLKIDACGVCASDFIEAKVWARKWKRFGHEITATVAETGTDVIDLSVGDQVAVALSSPCGGCTPCADGNFRKCNHLIAADQGGFAEYLLVKDCRLLHKVEPSIPVELAALAEPLTVILDAFHLAGLNRGDHLLVIGGGFIGKLALLTSKALGIAVQGVLSRKKHPDLTACLREAGGDYFSWHTFTGKTLAAPIGLKKKLSGLTGRVVVLHTAPAGFIPLYLSRLPFDSTIVNIGLSAFPKENAIKVDATRLIFKRLQMLSAFPVPALYMPQAITLLQQHAKIYSRLTTERMPLTRLPEIITRTVRSEKKILITMESCTNF
ncbi:MAG: alcohol dehydrogenase catalytic domain-containing protein, partial [Desulfobacterales bacterium]|nr:alcohol dehydrogenase catalytic domain-containing protein [Desulfobacterales bacterium]